MKVLIVEDNPVTGAALSEYLRQHGWETEWCLDTPCARVKAAMLKPDVVILDWVLPSNRVEAFLKELKAPAIIFTAATDAAVPPGVPVIHKPAEREEVLHVLNELAQRIKS